MRGGTILSSGSAFSGSEATPFINVVLGGFSDSNTALGPSAFNVTVNWGDGTTSVGTPVGSNGSFSVLGNHTYLEEGSYSFSFGVQDVQGGSSTSTGSATVADAPLVVVPLVASVSFNPGVPFTGVVGTFTDANPGAAPSDFVATVNWGDGTFSPGTIVSNLGNFSVSGSHTYASSGSFPLGVTVNDVGGSTASLNSSAQSVPEPGTLAIVLAGLGLTGLLRRRS